MKPRKIVQVVCNPGERCMALADDGSVWVIESVSEEAWGWRRVDWWPPLPPIEEPEGEEGE